MAQIQFGNTWWGEKWLDSLTGIDYDNRLPRGVRYARNGSVLDIDIAGNTITSRVSGRQRHPYKIQVSVTPFTAAEKHQIGKVITSNLYYLAALETRSLPTELCDDLDRLEISLFPKSWKSLKMECSCPDWAVPCKHIAAVIYIIANEVDKNPFILFETKGMDLLAVFASIGREEDPIPTLDSLKSTGEQYRTFDSKTLETVDFSTIPPLAGSILQLLTEKPLFSPGEDFKAILQKQYTKTARIIEKTINAADIREDLPETLFTSAEIIIGKEWNACRGSLKSHRETLAFSFDDAKPLTDYLEVLSAGDLQCYPPLLAWLIMCHSFALILLRNGGYIPEILSTSTNKKKSCLIRWIPALFNNETAAVFDTLVENLPRSLVRFGKEELPRREQTLFLLSLLLYRYIREADAVKDAAVNPVKSLFFCGTSFSPGKFEDQETAETIHLWLSRFFIRPKECFPVIKIREISDGEFTVEILVKDRNRPRPYTLKSFVSSDHKEQFSMLKDLGLLADYLPAVNRSLRKRGAVTEKGESFVRSWFDALPVLKTLNVRMDVPKLLHKLLTPRPTIRMAAEKEGHVKSYTSLAELLSFNWVIAAGDTFISDNEFLELIEESSDLVRYKDTYIKLEAAEVEKIKKRLEKELKISPLDALSIALQKSYEGIPVQTDEKLSALLSELLTPEETPIPENLNATLRPYQVKGFRWLFHNDRIGLGSLIADDMGLGKTLQVIAFLLTLKNSGDLKKQKALIGVPASLMTNWEREISRFAPSLTTHIYHGAKREIDKSADVTITTYSTLRLDHAQLNKLKWRTMIIDEAQNIKTPGTAQTKAVKSIKASGKIAMTGTPVENRLMDYWSVLDFIMKNLPGTMRKFKENFAVPIEKFREEAPLASFRQLTAPFILRRMKTDKSIISDLPDKIVSDRYVSLTKEQIGLYESLVNRIEELQELDDPIVRAGLIFKLITGLKQICNHPSLYLKEDSPAITQSGKTEALIELLNIIHERGEKTLVFTQYREMGDHLLAMCASAEEKAPLFFHGGLNRKKRDELIDAFQNDPQERVMILSLKAAGTGLNLTAANNVIHYDLWWNPAVENQATDRAFRIGQRRNVNVYRLICRGTFEEKIDAMIKEKSDLADLTVNVGEKWITDLSNKELGDLLRLEREEQV